MVVTLVLQFLKLANTPVELRLLCDEALAESACLLDLFFFAVQQRLEGCPHVGGGVHARRVVQVYASAEEVDVG